MSGTTNIDLEPVDLRILEIIQGDVTTSTAEIARKVGSSKTVVWRRIQRLMDVGVIKDRVAILDHRKMGLSMMVFANVKMARHNKDALPNFMDAVKAFPQVLECHCLMGHVDFLLKIVVPSIEEYEHFVWQKLSQIDGVQEVTSSISMSQSVCTTRLPLPITKPATKTRKRKH